MLELYLVRYFLAVAQTGSFSKAAAHVHVTQPSLSAGIAKLESALGRRLFHRTSRRVQLTDAGNRFLVHAGNIMRECDVCLEDVAQAKSRPLLRIGILTTIPAAVLGSAVAHAGIAGAAAHLEFIEGSERELLAKLDQGRLAAALTLQRDKSGRQERICSEGYSLALPHSHRLSAAREITPEALASDAMIVRRHCEVLSETSRHFTAHNVRPAFGLRTTSDEKALVLVRAGYGVTVMPDSYRHPGVKRVRLKGFGLRRTICLRFGRDGHESENALQGLAAAARAAFAGIAA